MADGDAGQIRRVCLVVAIFASLALAGCLKGGTVSRTDPRTEGGDVDGSDTTQDGGGEGVDTRERNATATSPPVVGNVTVEADHGSAWVNYTVRADVNATSVRYGREASSSNRRAPDEVGASGRRSVFLGFLEPDRTYRYVVGARLDSGETVTSEERIFRTAASPYAWADPAEALVRPGALITPEAAPGCTVAFILRNADNSSLYAATAGHCVRVGGQVRAGENTGPVFGTVVARGERFDWAVIRVHDDMRSTVSPIVHHWTGPAGLVAGPDGTEFDDVVCHFGWGSVWSWPREHTEATQSRCGRFFVYYRGEEQGQIVDLFEFRGKSAGGDSGSPVIDYRTGQALGILYGGTPPGAQPVGLIRGITLCSVLGLAELHGLELGLSAAPYRPPEHRPVPPTTVDPAPAWGADIRGPCAP